MSHARWPVMLWLLVMVVAIGYLLTHWRMVNDLTLFLPEEHSAEQRFLLHQMRDGSQTRQLFVRLSGPDDASLARHSDELAHRLDDTKAFSQISNRTPTLESLVATKWFAYRYLIDPQFDMFRFTKTGLKQALSARLDELRSPAYRPFQSLIPPDPVAAFRRWLQQSHGDSPFQSRHGVWFDNEERALLIVTTEAGGFDLDAQQHAVTTIKQLSERIDSAVSVDIIGAGVIGLATRDTIRQEVQYLSIGASFAVVLILLLAYRSAPILLLAVLPLSSAIVAGMVVSIGVFGQIHGIALAFSVTLLGITLDYPLHFFSHRHSSESSAQTMHRIWPTLLLGVISTLAGFSIMAMAVFPGLQQIALFTCSGLVAAALVTRWVLPVLASRVSLQGSSISALPRRVRAPRQWSLLVLAFAAMVLYLDEGVRWQDNIAVLSPAPERVLSKFQALQPSQTGSPDSRLLITADTVESMLQLCERVLPQIETLHQDGLVERYVAPCQILPSASRQRVRQRHLSDVNGISNAVTQALHDMPFKPTTFQPFIDALNRSAELEPLVLDDIRHTHHGRLLESLIGKDGEGVTGQIMLYGATNLTSLQNRVRESADLFVISTHQAAQGMMMQFRQELTVWLGVGIAVIATLILLVTRSLHRASRVLVPVLTATAATVAVLRIMDVPLTVFHLIALMLVVGLGVDYSLFFQRYESSQQRGGTRHAITVCAVSTGTVFGMLALSELPILRAIGITVVIGIILAYVLSYLSQESSPANLS